MRNFYNIIILSKTIKTTSYYVITEPITLKNQTTLQISNQELSFDYLIFDDISLINDINSSSIMCDNLIPVTNFFHQTNLENIFFGKCIDEIIESIINNEIQ